MEARNLAEAPTQMQTQQKLKDAIKVVGFIGRWLFLLGLSAGWVLWVASWDWSAATTPLAQPDTTIAAGADWQDQSSCCWSAACW
jgi:hypothetical protein